LGFRAAFPLRKKGAAFFWNADRVLVRRVKGRQDSEPFSFSQAPAGKNLRLSAVVWNMAPGSSYSDNTQPEPESEEPYIVIHANAKIFAGRGSLGQPATAANQD
jgi:hypothetical protein